MRARKVTTLPATSTATTSINTNTSKSCARTERSYQSARHQRFRKVGACGGPANAAADSALIGVFLWALCVMPQMLAEHRPARHVRAAALPNWHYGMSAFRLAWV